MKALRLIPLIVFSTLFSLSVVGQESSARPDHLEKPEFQDALLDKMVGEWVMESKMQDQILLQDMSVKWALHHRYLQIYQLSREVIKGGGTGYEAEAFIGWDKASSRYVTLWLDVTSSDTLSPDAFGYAKPTENSLAFVFNNYGGSNQQFHMTFTYEPNNDTWRIKIEAMMNGKLMLFSDSSLKRKS